MNRHGLDLKWRLGKAGTVRCEPGWHLGPEWAPRLEDYDLWCVGSGRGWMDLEDGKVDLVPGSVVWMRPGRRYEATQDPEARLRVHYIHFEGLNPRNGKYSARRRPPLEVMRTRRVEYLDIALRRVMALMKEPGGGELAARLFGVILADLVHEHRLAGREGGGSGMDKHHREKVQLAASRIRESPGDLPSVEKLAQWAGYHPDHFSRLFAKVMGEGPQEYMIRAKMERARELLAESAMSVGMIAEALGFRDIYFFSRQFRQRTGLTPTGYRKSLDG
jgi:AraC-like DNA-binding protein/mannose-6-phosphate isomerase-like protein (cupin superfamily)